MTLPIQTHCNFELHYVSLGSRVTWQPCWKWQMKNQAPANTLYISAYSILQQGVCCIYCRRVVAGMRIWVGAGESFGASEIWQYQPHSVHI